MLFEELQQETPSKEDLRNARKPVLVLCRELYKMETRIGRCTHKALLKDETAQFTTMQERAKAIDGMYKDCGANVPDGKQLSEFVEPVKQFVQANRMPAVSGFIDFEFSFDR